MIWSREILNAYNPLRYRTQEHFKLKIWQDIISQIYIPTKKPVLHNKHKQWYQKGKKRREPFHYLGLQSS
jgi:hypothetical protein